MKTIKKTQSVRLFRLALIGGVILFVFSWFYIEINNESNFEAYIFQFVMYVFIFWFFVLIGIIFLNAELFWVEVILSIFTIFTMAGISAYVYKDYILLAKVSEIIQLAGGAKVPIIEYYSYHGQWPGQLNNQEFSLKIQGKYTQNLRIENGAAIRGELKENGLLLTIRPAIADSQPKMVAWLCGNAIPPTGLMAQGENQTTMPASYLSHVCR